MNSSGLHRPPSVILLPQEMVSHEIAVEEQRESISRSDSLFASFSSSEDLPASVRKISVFATVEILEIQRQENILKLGFWEAYQIFERNGDNALKAFFKVIWSYIAGLPYDEISNYDMFRKTYDDNREVFDSEDPTVLFKFYRALVEEEEKIGQPTDIILSATGSINNLVRGEIKAIRTLRKEIEDKYNKKLSEAKEKIEERAKSLKQEERMQARQMYAGLEQKRQEQQEATEAIDQIRVAEHSIRKELTALGREKNSLSRQMEEEIRRKVNRQVALAERVGPYERLRGEIEALEVEKKKEIQAIESKNGKGSTEKLEKIERRIREKSTQISDLAKGYNDFEDIQEVAEFREVREEAQKLNRKIEETKKKKAIFGVYSSDAKREIRDMIRKLNGMKTRLVEISRVIDRKILAKNEAHRQRERMALQRSVEEKHQVQLQGIEESKRPLIQTLNDLIQRSRELGRSHAELGAEIAALEARTQDFREKVLQRVGFEPLNDFIRWSVFSRALTSFPENMGNSSPTTHIRKIRQDKFQEIEEELLNLVGAIPPETYTFFEDPGNFGVDFRSVRLGEYPEEIQPFL